MRLTIVPASMMTRARLLLALASLLSFTGSFGWNLWGVARQAWFEQFQRGTECHVVGRLVKSRQDGMLSAGGLLGVGVVHFEGPPASPYSVHFRRAELATGLHLRIAGEDWPSREQIDEQYAAYRDGSRFQIYSPYLSQIGGQGLVFGALDAVLPLAPSTKLGLFGAATALLSAAALTAIVLWFATEFSPVIGWWVLSTGLLSQWLTGFGGKLWWSLWAFYLPLLVVGCYEWSRAAAPERRSPATLGAIAFAAVLAKCFFNGYEYITTTLLMMVVPTAYYALRDGAGKRRLVRDGLALGLGSTAAVAASLLVLVAQAASLTGRAAFGLRHIAFALAVRSRANPEDFPPSFAESLNASAWSVLATYVGGPYFDFGGRGPALRYSHLFALFAAATLVAWWHGRGDARYRALLATTWLSLLAPLSWLVVFKAHSQDHTHMNFVVWQMPFSFLGFALCGVAAGLWNSRMRIESSLPWRPRRSSSTRTS
jgi:hypothetical protein